MYRRRVCMRVGFEVSVIHRIDEGVCQTAGINLSIRRQSLFLSSPKDEYGSHRHCIEGQSADDICIDQGNKCLGATQLRCHKHIQYAKASTKNHRYVRSCEFRVDPRKRFKKEPVLCHGEIDSWIC